MNSISATLFSESFHMRDLIIESVRQKGFFIIDNLLSNKTISNARLEYYSALNQLPLHAQGIKFNPADLTLTPWRKQSIGSKTGSGEPYSQILQSTYFSPHDSNYPYLSSIFSSMISLRNHIINMPETYGNDIANNAFWNACRVHHYPQGGGHMAAHRDTLFPKLLKSFDIPFLQMMVTFSQKNIDFKIGGGYIIDNSNNKIFFESQTNIGSIIFFNGSVLHGVEDIDPNELLNFSSRAGRMALFVNLYKNLILE